MAQDILLGRMRYEIAVTGSPQATVNIKNLNLRLGTMSQKTKENDLVLSRFLTKAKLGWATLGLTAAAAIKSIVNGSSLLSMALGAPFTLLQTLGTAIDVGFSGALAGLAGWLAKTQGDIINWGAELGRANDKVGFILESLGKLAATPFKVIIDYVVNHPTEAASAVAQSGIDLINAPGNIAKGFLEGIGVPDPVSSILGYGAGAMAWLGAGSALGSSGIRSLMEGGGAGAMAKIGLGGLATSIGELLTGPIGIASAILDIGSRPITSEGHYDPGQTMNEYEARNGPVTINNYFASAPGDVGYLNWSQANRMATFPGI